MILLIKKRVSSFYFFKIKKIIIKINLICKSCYYWEILKQMKEFQKYYIDFLVMDKNWRRKLDFLRIIF